MKNFTEYYFHLDADEKHPEIYISRIPVDYLHLYARGILKVKAAAYERQFKVGNQNLKPGYSRSEFDFSDTKVVDTERRRMITHMNKQGSSYWLAHREKYFKRPAFEPVGFVRVSPSNPKWKIWEIPTCNVDDIAVSAPHEGIGDALMFAALYAFNADDMVTADVPNSSEPYFESLGFEKKQDPTSEVNINGIPFIRERYEAFCVAGVRAFLLSRQQRLQHVGLSI